LDLVKKYEQQLQESCNKANELKEKLTEANAKIAMLDEQLNDAVNGNLDEVAKKHLAEVDKLKKEIKDLECEIEEYEDDIKDLKKKLNNKETENSKLQDDLSKEQRACKQLCQDLEVVKNDLEDKSKDLKLKAESLAFIQEILTAKQVSDTSTKDLHKQIDAIVSYISGELKDNIKASYTFKDEDAIFGSGLQRWAIAAKKTWIQGKTTIAFVGEFSAGKTSIVNRILSQDNPNIPLLPVSTKATTAIPTYISGGPSTLYQFVSPDNLQKVISEETIKKISKEVLDQVKGVSSLIQYFVMKYKNPNLERISILDTPGFNSNDKEDAERTIGVINECDALFWVFDVNAGTVNRSSISLIKENLKKPLYVIINKVDTKAETEINSVEQLIRKTLRDEGVTVQKFIRFSAKASLDDIMQPILSVTHSTEQESYIVGFREMLNGFVEELSKNVQKLNQKQLALHKQGDKLVDKYNDAIRKLGNNCEEAANIPQWTEHIFSKDRYEMNASQGNRLINLLNTICVDRADELCNLYNEQMENQRNAQQADSDYIDEKVKWQNLNSCAEQFEKLVKTLQTK
jgi:GTPase SAR1 family protein